jgi:hypothetical protein
MLLKSFLMSYLVLGEGRFSYGKIIICLEVDALLLGHILTICCYTFINNMLQITACGDSNCVDTSSLLVCFCDNSQPSTLSLDSDL